MPGVAVGAARNVPLHEAAMPRAGMDGPRGVLTKPLRHESGACARGSVHEPTSAHRRLFSLNMALGRHSCHRCTSDVNQLEPWAIATKLHLHQAPMDLCHRLCRDSPCIRRWRWPRRHPEVTPRETLRVKNRIWCPGPSWRPRNLGRSRQWVFSSHRNRVEPGLTPGYVDSCWSLHPSDGPGEFQEREW